MTVYAVSASSSFSGICGMTAPSLAIAISPQSFSVRVIQVDMGMAVGGAVPGPNVVYTSLARYTPSITRYSTGTSSGGGSVTSAALRHGAPAVSSTSRTGTSVSVSGTGTLIAQLQQVAAQAQTNDQKSFAPPADFTIDPGGVLLIQTNTIGTFGQSDQNVSGTPALTVYFEEYRLSWPY